MRDLIKALIGIAISLITILLIFRFTNVDISLDVLKNLDLRFLSIAFILQASFWFLWALRLKLISKLLGNNLDLSYSFEITLSSMFFAAITPSSAGGEPLRVKLIGDRCGSYGLATAVVLIERVLDGAFFAISLPILVIITGFFTKLGFRISIVFSILLILFLISLYVLLKDPSRIRCMINCFGSLMGRIIGERATRITEKMIKEAENFREALIEMIKAQKSQSAVIFMLTVIMWILGFLIPSFILMSLREDPSFLLSITSQVIIVVVSLIPLTPGSSGIAEASMAYLYSEFVPHRILGVLVAIWRTITYYLNIVVGSVVSIKVLGKAKYTCKQ